MDQLLAIDPGTHRAGRSHLQRRDDLSWTELISAPDKMEVEERIGYILKELERIIQVHGKDIRQVAAERPMGINRARPAPELGDADTPDKTMGHQRAAPVGMDGLQPLDRGGERSGSGGIGVSGRTSYGWGSWRCIPRTCQTNRPRT